MHAVEGLEEISESDPAFLAGGPDFILRGKAGLDLEASAGSLLSAVGLNQGLETTAFKNTHGTHLDRAYNARRTLHHDLIFGVTHVF